MSYTIQNPNTIDLLESLTNSLGIMSNEMLEYIQEQRRRLTPKTPAELRRDFDRMRRHRYTPNECARGMDDYGADQVEELRRHLLTTHPETMGDYIQEFGLLKFTGEHSDVWSYTFSYENIELYYEIWAEHIEQGVLIRCRQLNVGVNTLRCGTTYEVSA